MPLANLPKILMAGFGAVLFSGVVIGCAPATDPAEMPSVNASDLITEADIARSPMGYKLKVPGVGDVYLRGMKALRDGELENCRVHKPSLIDTLTADPPGPQETKWLELTIYDSPFEPGEKICLPPLGGSCYIIIKRLSAPL